MTQQHDNENNTKKPLVYSCAGCSDAGQMSYRLALSLNQQKKAEMSCLAGLGADKKKFLKQVEDRNVWVIDGCPIECAKGVMDRLGISVNRHIKLHEMNVRKYDHYQTNPSLKDVYTSVINESGT